STTTPSVITRSDPRRIEIEWSDGRKTTYSAAELRALCPCAMCVNEITGVRVHDPSSVPSELTQSEARMAGHDALTMTFSGRHHTAIYTSPCLRAQEPA